jgi:hypothetical protein
VRDTSPVPSRQGLFDESLQKIGGNEMILYAAKDALLQNGSPDAKTIFARRLAVVAVFGAIVAIN